MVSSAAGYAACTPAERTDAIGELAGVISSLQAELASLVTAAGAAEDWRDDGATDMAVGCPEKSGQWITV